jgi:release factor glutamine methyltransferase
VAGPASFDRTVETLRAAGCVFAEDEAALLHAEAASADALARMLARRVAGDPLEQIVGWAEFRGLRVVVEPGVFVPRRRTGFLAGLAVAAAREGAVVVDMCCGAGAVAMAVRAESKAGEVHAADVDAAAVACARRNLPPGRVHLGDLFAALPARLRGRVDVVVANAPYVPTGAVAAMPPEARLHEPLVALDGGGDGLDVARRVVAGARGWLAPGGVLLVETSVGQAPALREWFVRNGFAAAVEVDEEIGGTAVRGVLDAGPGCA